MPDHPNLCKAGCGSLTADTSGTCPWCQNKKKDVQLNYKCDNCSFTASTVNYEILLKKCPQCNEGNLVVLV